jgi:hypothetical protein
MEVYMQSLEPDVRRAINSIHDELASNSSSASHAATMPTPQPKPKNNSAAAKARVEADAKLAEADNIILRGLGVRWEPEAGSASS